MSDLQDFDHLFLDPAKIRLTTTSHEPSDDVPHIDFDLEVEGDLRSCATLSYSFEDRRWVAQIRQSDSDDGPFDRAADATRQQIEILIAALPQERRDHVAELSASYDQGGAFRPAAPAA